MKAETQVFPWYFLYKAIECGFLRTPWNYTAHVSHTDFCGLCHQMEPRL